MQLEWKGEDMDFYCWESIAYYEDGISRLCLGDFVPLPCLSSREDDVLSSRDGIPYIVFLFTPVTWTCRKICTNKYKEEIVSRTSGMRFYSFAHFTETSVILYLSTLRDQYSFLMKPYIQSLPTLCYREGILSFF